MKSLLCFFLLLCSVAQAEPNVLWRFTMDINYRQPAGDGKVRTRTMKAAPRLVTALGHEGKVVIGPGRATDTPALSLACLAREVVPGHPRLLKVQIGLSFDAPEVQGIEQTFETVIIEGEPWTYTWQKVQNIDFTVRAIANIEPEGHGFAGEDAQGKPIWKPIPKK